MFLDELPEFRRHVIDALRQPLEDHAVTIARAQITLSYPARFTLVAAMNPCPCGYLSDSRRTCTCSPAQIRRYRARVSGPLLDRIDLHIEVPARAYNRILKVARTIADLAGADQIRSPHLAEAIQYRSLDRQLRDDARFAT